MTRSAVVICPGRGTYNQSELGYLAGYHADQTALLSRFDDRRGDLGQTSLAELDRARQFSRALYTRGDNASGLIFASALFDAWKIPDMFEVVAVTGNSMGWYIALAVGGAATADNAFEIVNTMGSLMHENLIGGQSIYPFVDENWREIPGLREELLERVEQINSRPDHELAVSIHLGGMLVVAGNEAGLSAFENGLPPLQGRYPMRLHNHAAFHTHLQAPVAAQGRDALPLALFDCPEIPLIDGRGKVWFPGAVTASDLRAYTLGTQVVAPYDFTTAVQVAARTFAPEVFIITGPGSTLGGAVAQALIAINWKGLDSKESFLARQKNDPVLLAMGRAEDRARVLGGIG